MDLSLMGDPLGWDNRALQSKKARVCRVMLSVEEMPEGGYLQQASHPTVILSASHPRGKDSPAVIWQRPEEARGRGRDRTDNCTRMIGPVKQVPWACCLRAVSESPCVGGEAYLELPLPIFVMLLRSPFPLLLFLL